MASSDEEDLEALRNAALASLRQKQAAQEPQGIQVVSRSAIHSQQVAEPFPHPEANFDYTEYGDVPFALQQAVLSRQARGRGRGFFRGRGRGWGNRFPPKPEPQSALIVIQPSGGQDDGAKVEVSSKDSRPFLLRPQDKWAATESGNQSPTPTKPKDKSKFSRYDDATDSEDDDDVVERRRRKSLGEAMDVSLEDVSSDTEVEVHTNENNEAELHDHHAEIEIHNREHDLNESVEMNGKDTDQTEGESAIDTSHNITIDEVHSDLNTSQKSDTDVTARSERKEDLNEASSGTSVQNILESANKEMEEENSLLDKNTENTLNTGEGSDDTPLRDERTPLQDEIRQEDSVSNLQDEIRQEDSVSNSYSAFSRFNRRNRSDSESAEESAESDVELKSVSDSRNSSVSREGSRSRSDTEEDIADEDINSVDIEAVPDKEEKGSPGSHHIQTENQSSQESRTSVTSLRSPTSSAKSSSAASSSSDSDSESSSSSSSSSSTASSSESESSQETSRSQKSMSKTKTKVKTENRKSETERDLKARSNSESKISKSNDLNEKSLNRSHKKGDNSRKDSGKINADYSRRKNDRGSRSPVRKGGSRSPVRKGGSRSPVRKGDREHLLPKKSIKDRLQEEVKADPEFDATNYRDETMYQRNDRRGRHGKSQSHYDRKHERDKRLDDSKSYKKSKDYEKDDGRSKSKSEREKPGEKRYFEEIGKLKKEEAKSSRDTGSERDFVMSYTHRKRSRSVSVDSKNERRKYPQPQETKRKERDAKYSKSDSYIASTKVAKSRNDLRDSLKTKSKERRKSDERSKRNNNDVKESSKQKNTKEEQKSKRRSIEEKLKRLASQTAKSGSESDSDKSISSLSDFSSDSETETWRNKKHGASRNTADIELERRRRELKQRELEKEKRRKAEKLHTERGDGDRERNRKPKYGGSDSNIDKYSSEYSGRQAYRKGDSRDRRKDDMDENLRPKYYHRKNMVFYEEDSGKKFEELSSESDSDVRKGVTSVVKTSMKKSKEEIPSLLDISVSKRKLSKNESQVRSKSPKKERLIIHVQKSSDEEISSTKTKKKKVKKRKKYSSDDDEEKPSLQQVVNVTFDKDIEPKKSSKSVYERLGKAVDKNTSSRLAPSGDSELRKSHTVTVPSGGKRIKLSSGSKYGKTDRSKTDRNKDGDSNDALLNLRIQKIQERNAEILRRKMEVEQDKEQYG